MGKVCASLMTWAVKLVFIANQDLWQFRLDGCVRGDARHESDCSCDDLPKTQDRLLSSSLLDTSQWFPPIRWCAGQPMSRPMLITKGGRPSGAAANAKFIHWKKTQSLRGSKNGAVTRPQKVTRILFLGIYFVFIITQIAETNGPKFRSARQTQK